MNLPHGLYYVPRDRSTVVLLGQSGPLPLDDEETAIVASMLDAAKWAVGPSPRAFGDISPATGDLFGAPTGLYYVTVDDSATWELSREERPAIENPERAVARGLVESAQKRLREASTV